MFRIKPTEYQVTAKVLRNIGKSLSGGRWCPETDLNRRHADFQSKPIFEITSSCNNSSVKLEIENQALSNDLSNSNDVVKLAALWLKTHRNECDGALIPFIRERFPLTAMEAIEAVKLASSLARGEHHG